MTDIHNILCAINLCQYRQMQCVDDAIASQDILLNMGICLCLITSHAIPCISLATTDS